MTVTKKQNPNLSKTNTLLILSISALFIILSSILLYKYLQKYALFEQQEVNPTQQSAKVEKLQNQLDPSSDEHSNYLVGIKDGSLTSPTIKDLDTGEVFKYTVKIPEGWEVTRAEAQGNEFSVILTKGEYQLEIESPRFSDSTCVFPTDNPPDGSYESFDQYKELDAAFGTIRIGRNDPGLYEDIGIIIFRACQQITGLSYWEPGTKIGNILFRVPLKYEPNVIHEMENIIVEIGLHSS